MFPKTKSNSVHKLIMEQIQDVETCLVHFEGFVRAVCTPEARFETLRNLASCISKAEANADISLRRMIDSFTGGSFLPATRKEIIEIATSCDRVANKCEAFAVAIIQQKFLFPKDFSEDLLNILSIIHTQFDLLEESISRLFADFNNMLKDHSILDSIRREETKVDSIETALYEKVYALDIDLAHRMQMAEFLKLICGISDIIEDIADKIQIMLVTRKA